MKLRFKHNITIYYLKEKKMKSYRLNTVNSRSVACQREGFQTIALKKFWISRQASVVKFAKLAYRYVFIQSTK